MSLISENDFLVKYGINQQNYPFAKIKWNEMEDIYGNYSKLFPELESRAKALHQILLGAKNVHWTRFRVKDPEHLIEKIIRKKMDNTELDIHTYNYLDSITDVIGVRLIHKFIDEWEYIDSYISKELGNRVQSKIAYHRISDEPALIQTYKNAGFKTITRPGQYKSLHYLLKYSNYPCEIQVRTIYEEAWGEIDHTMRYPYQIDNSIYNRFFKILNSLTGSLDEMSSFIKEMKDIVTDDENLIKYKVDNGKALKNRNDVFLSAKECLQNSNHYRTVVDGPYFLHPEWYFKQYGDEKDDNSILYDLEVKKFMLSKCKVKNENIRIISRNADRYKHKIKQIVPRERLNEFKTSVINEIINLFGNEGDKGPFLNCVNTALIDAPFIYSNQVILSNKTSNETGITGGFLQGKPSIVDEHIKLFDDAFNSDLENQKDEMFKMIDFINNI